MDLSHSQTHATLRFFTQRILRPCAPMWVVTCDQRKSQARAMSNFVPYRSSINNHRTTKVKLNLARHNGSTTIHFGRLSTCMVRNCTTSAGALLLFHPTSPPGSPLLSNPGRSGVYLSWLLGSSARTRTRRKYLFFICNVDEMSSMMLIPCSRVPVARPSVAPANTDVAAPRRSWIPRSPGGHRNIDDSTKPLVRFWCDPLQSTKLVPYDEHYLPHEDKQKHIIEWLQTK